MSPLEKYENDLKHPEFFQDPAQENAIAYTNALYKQLVGPENRDTNIVSRLLSLVTGNTQAVKGLYFWGGVGRGKTYIVDAFFECLPFAEKKRMHFHRFMRMVHTELKSYKKEQEPLKHLADNLASATRVICFDEFHVSDITDAMLLGGLLDALFNHGVVLVATSNEHPNDLYRDGLQRERFLPAIKLILEYTHIVNVDNNVDYRLRYLDKAEIYHHPLDAAGAEMLLNNFVHIAPDEGRVNSTIEIEGRKIPAVRNADGVVWFEFFTICDAPRGAADYIEIGRQFQTVLISGIPVMDDDKADIVRRFITLVDEFYDRSVKLILTAESDPEGLYSGNRLKMQFQRTVSRLIEMQSNEYLARQHLTS